MPLTIDYLPTTSRLYYHNIISLGRAAHAGDARANAGRLQAPQKRSGPHLIARPESGLLAATRSAASMISVSPIFKTYVLKLDMGFLYDDEPCLTERPSWIHTTTLSSHPSCVHPLPLLLSSSLSSLSSAVSPLVALLSPLSTLPFPCPPLFPLPFHLPSLRLHPIHTSMSPCVHACIHPYIHPGTHPCMHPCINACIYTCLHVMGWCRP